LAPLNPSFSPPDSIPSVWAGQLLTNTALCKLDRRRDSAQNRATQASYAFQNEQNNRVELQSSLLRTRDAVAAPKGEVVCSVLMSLFGTENTTTATEKSPRYALLGLQ